MISETTALQLHKITTTNGADGVMSKTATLGIH